MKDMEYNDFGSAKGLVAKFMALEKYSLKEQQESAFDIDAFFGKSFVNEKEIKREYEEKLLQEILTKLEKVSETVKKNYELSQKIHDDVRDAKNTILNLQLLIKPIVNYPIQITQIFTILFGGLSFILLFMNLVTNKIFISFSIGVSILIMSVGLFVVAVMRGREIKHSVKDVN